MSIASGAKYSYIWWRNWVPVGSKIIYDHNSLIMSSGSCWWSPRYPSALGHRPACWDVVAIRLFVGCREDGQQWSGAVHWSARRLRHIRPTNTPGTQSQWTLSHLTLSGCRVVYCSPAFVIGGRSIPTTSIRSRDSSFETSSIFVTYRIVAKC